MQGSQPWRIWRASSSIPFFRTPTPLTALRHWNMVPTSLTSLCTIALRSPWSLPLSHLSGRCPFSTSEIIPRSLTYTKFRSGSSVTFDLKAPRLYELPSTLDCTVLLGALRTLTFKFITPQHLVGRLLKSQHPSLRLSVPF